MSGLGEIPVPREHPDNDLLADLAAEVLPRDLAERVQDHVMGCAHCAGLLAEAEGIRSLLRQTRPEAMPLEVLSRLEQAMTDARLQDSGALGTQPTTVMPAQSGRPTTAAGQETRRGRRAARGAADDESGLTGGQILGAPTGAFTRPPTSALDLAAGIGPATPVPEPEPDRGTGNSRRIARSVPGPADPNPPTGVMAPLTGRFTAIGGEKPPSRLNRMSRPTQQARRQALAEQKSDRPSRVRPALLVAAGVILVLGLGGLAVHLISSSGTEEDSTASASAGSSASAPLRSAAANGAAGAPGLLLAPVQSTATNYTRTALKTQVGTLVASSQKLTASGTGKAAPATAQGQQLLRSPAALTACLTAIGANQQPVAVDLARFAGQDAAIIVLPAAGGGYQVNVVARDCRAGADGTIAVINLPAP